MDEGAISLLRGICGESPEETGEESIIRVVIGSSISFVDITLLSLTNGTVVGSEERGPETCPSEIEKEKEEGDDDADSDEESRDDDDDDSEDDNATEEEVIGDGEGDGTRDGGEDARSALLLLFRILLFLNWVVLDVPRLCFF